MSIQTFLNQTSNPHEIAATGRERQEPPSDRLVAAGTACYTGAIVILDLIRDQPKYEVPADRTFRQTENLEAHTFETRPDESDFARGRVSSPPPTVCTSGSGRHGTRSFDAFIAKPVRQASLGGASKRLSVGTASENVAKHIGRKSAEPVAVSRGSQTQRGSHRIPSFAGWSGL